MMENKNRSTRLAEATGHASFGRLSDARRNNYGRRCVKDLPLWVLWRSVLSILFHQPSLFLYIVDKNKDDRTNIIKTVFDHWRRTSKRVRGLYGTVEWIWMSQSYRIWSWNEWSWRWWWSWWRWWWCGGGSSHRRPSSKSEKRRRRGVSSPGIRNDARDVFLYILSSSPPCGS